jgi:putative hydrolase of the HAD superfamily
MRQAVDVVLFDLGGVLIRLGGVSPMRELAGIDDDGDLWQRWLSCRWVRSFEAGQCSESEFAEGVVADWGLSISPAAYLDAFRRWPEGPLPGAEDLLTAARDKVSIGCLSNTNALHWNDRAGRWPLMAMFDFRFLSFELGLVKPDRDIFEHVARALPASPSRVLFLDDNAVNVEQACALGFSGAQVRGVEEAHAALVTAGVLPSR